MWKIVERDGGLYLETNLLDIEEWASYFYDFSYGLKKNTLDQTELTDLLYEAENQGLLRFGALTGQGDELAYENKMAILSYYKNRIVGNENTTEKTKNRDPLFVDAGKKCICKGVCSESYLQKEFKIKSSRAFNIIKQLYDAGVVGEEGENGQRKIYMNLEEFEKISH